MTKRAVREASRARPGTSAPPGRATGARLLAARHWPFLLLLAVGTTVRVITLVAFRPALLFVQDSYQYLINAQHLAPDLVRPLGYPLLLRALSWTGRLGVVPIVQHLLGLGCATLLYLVLRRLGVRSWLAALGAAPLLLDAYQVDVEQFVLAESLAALLLTAVLALLLWWDRPPVWACAVAGLLLAFAGLTRAVLLVLTVPVGLFLLVRLVGVRRLAATAAAMALPLFAYASWFHAEYGHFSVQAYDGFYLAGRVMPFADCTDMKLTRVQHSLCDPRPPGRRPENNWYIWQPRSPLRNLAVPPDTNRNAIAGSFARTIIRHQPGEYLSLVAGDFAHYFAPGRRTGHGDYPVMYWQFWKPFVPVEYQRLVIPPGYPYRGLIGYQELAGRRGYSAVAIHGFHGERIEGHLNTDLAARLWDYQRWAYTPGPLLAGCMVLVLVPWTCRRLSYARRRAHWAALLFATCGVLVLLVPCISSVFDYRYLVAALPLLPPAGALGLELLLTRRPEVTAVDAAPSPGTTSPAAWPRAPWTYRRSHADRPTDPILIGKRWVGERTHARINGAGKLWHCTNADSGTVSFYLTAAFHCSRIHSTHPDPLPLRHPTHRPAP